jgi:hypothetical protein
MKAVFDTNMITVNLSEEALKFLVCAIQKNDPENIESTGTSAMRK